MFAIKLFTVLTTPLYSAASHLAFAHCSGKIILVFSFLLSLSSIMLSMIPSKWHCHFLFPSVRILSGLLAGLSINGNCQQSWNISLFLPCNSALSLRSSYGATTNHFIFIAILSGRLGWSWKMTGLRSLCELCEWVGIWTQISLPSTPLTGYLQSRAHVSCYELWPMWGN